MMLVQRGLRTIFTVMLMMLLNACAHQLEIKNLSNYQSNSISTLEDQVVIGIVPSATDVHSERLIKGIGTEIGKYSSGVILPYSNNSNRPVDVIANVSVRPEYKGSGWNFWINFPGFLIWTPAWNGYVYKVNYDVSVLLTDARSNQKIGSFAIPVHLDIRHADSNRTWTEVSWLEVGVIAFVGGIMFTQYDENVSPLVAQTIQAPIGDYLAQEIITRINSYGMKNTPVASAQNDQ